MEHLIQQKNFIPVCAGFTLTALQSGMLSPTTFILPLILTTGVFAAYAFETVVQAEEKQEIENAPLTYPDICLFPDKNEYIKTFDPNYEVKLARQEAIRSANSLPILVAFAVTAVAFLLAPHLAIAFNAALALFYLTWLHLRGDLKWLRPTFSMFFFCLAFGVLAWQGTIWMAGVLPLAVFVAQDTEI